MATTITVLERRSTEPVPMLALGVHAEYPGRSGWHAQVQWDGTTLFLSRLDDEDRWVIDGFIPSGTAMPSWMHGWGSRVTSLTPAPADVAELLDSATEQAA